jgi:hypothetical protein
VDFETAREDARPTILNFPSSPLAGSASSALFCGQSVFKFPLSTLNLCVFVSLLFNPFPLSALGFCL